MEVIRLLPLRIGACTAAVGIMTGAAFNHSVTAVNDVVGHITETTGRAGWIMAGLTDGLFVLIVNIIIASLVQGVAVFARNAVALIVRRVNGHDHSGRQYGYDTDRQNVTETYVHDSYFKPISGNRVDDLHPSVFRIGGDDFITPNQNV